MPSLCFRRKKNADDYCSSDHFSSKQMPDTQQQKWTEENRPNDNDVPLMSGKQNFEQNQEKFVFVFNRRFWFV